MNIETITDNNLENFFIIKINKEVQNKTDTELMQDELKKLIYQYSWHDINNEMPNEEGYYLLAIKDNVGKKNEYIKYVESYFYLSSVNNQSGYFVILQKNIPEDKNFVILKWLQVPLIVEEKIEPKNQQTKEYYPSPNYLKKVLENAKRVYMITDKELNSLKENIYNLLAQDSLNKDETIKSIDTIFSSIVEKK